MTELRTDWLTGRSVFFAAHRADRPNEYAASSNGTAPNGTVPNGTTADTPANCPFCPGHESVTPPSVYIVNDDAGHWRVRVVSNKFPVVAPEETAATGAHEVIIESARHVDRVSALSVDELADVLTAYRHRLRAWQSMGRFGYGLVFKNQGPAAGASLSHVHSQLIALPEPPTPVAAELARAQASFAEHDRCSYCRLIDDERQLGERVVLERDGLIAFCPYVSIQPCEVWLMPTMHEPWFEQRTLPTGTDPLAPVLHALVTRIESLLPQPAYNLLVRTAPWQASAARCGHWRIEILPRVNAFAGFELATHMYINPICPTRAAQQIRLS